MQSQSICHWLKIWLFNTPLRALNRAYLAASLIQQIEVEYFGTEDSYAHFLNSQPEMKLILELCFKKYLRVIKLGLAEFKYSYWLLGTRKSDYIPKFKLIDQVLAKYKYHQNSQSMFSRFKKTTTNPSQGDNYSYFVTIETQARKIISE